MKKGLFLVIVLLVNAIPASTKNIRFEPIGKYDTCTDPDQNQLVNFLVVGDTLYYIHSFYSVHQERGWFSLWAIDTIHNRYFKLVQSDTSYPYYMTNPISPGLTCEIFFIDGIIHFPDRENYSYQCSLDGEYLGRFADFQKPDANETLAKGIVMGGKSIEFPVTLNGCLYTNRYLTSRWILFVGSDHYLIVDREEFAQVGESTSNQKYLPFPSDRISDVHFLQTTDKTRAYIFYKTSSEYKISILNMTDSIPHIELKSMTIDQPYEETSFSNCDFRYEKPQFFNHFFYRLELSYHEYTNRFIKYEILGLEGVSGLNADSWELSK